MRRGKGGGETRDLRREMGREILISVRQKKLKGDLSFEEKDGKQGIKEERDNLLS